MGDHVRTVIEIFLAGGPMAVVGYLFERAFSGWIEWWLE